MLWKRHLDGACAASGTRTCQIRSPCPYRQPARPTCCLLAPNRDALTHSEKACSRLFAAAHKQCCPWHLHSCQLCKVATCKRIARTAWPGLGQRWPVRHRSFTYTKTGRQAQGHSSPLAAVTCHTREQPYDSRLFGGINRGGFDPCDRDFVVDASFPANRKEFRPKTATPASAMGKRTHACKDGD